MDNVTVALIIATVGFSISLFLLFKLLLKAHRDTNWSDSCNDDLD
jgi:hypothetical protein